MVDLAEIQAVYYMVAATGVIIAAAYYVMNIRSTQRNMKANLETRQAQMFMQIYGKWSEGDFSSYWFDLSDTVWTDYGKFKENLLENHGKMKSLSVLIRFFEGLGVLVKENLLDIRLIALTMAGDTRIFWEQYKPIVGELRRDWKHPRLMSETEYLYDELMRYMETHPELKT